MAPIPEKILTTVHDYLNCLQKEIPITKAILFGSYDENSDVDLAVFSRFFNNQSRVDSTTFLLTRALHYGIDLEPIAFQSEEYEERLGIVEEIVRTGIEIEI